MSAEPELDALLALAFERDRAINANEAIARARLIAGEGEPAHSYECVLPAEGRWRFLLEEVTPRLVYFLESRGARPPHFGRMFASFFVDDALVFVRISDVIDAVGRALGASLAELERRYGANAGAGEQRLLPQIVVKKDA